MANGIEVDDEITAKLVCEGYWPPGTLVLLEGQVFIILGYSFWGWIHDCDESEVFYDAILHHVATGIVSSFPLMKVTQTGKLAKEER